MNTIRIYTAHIKCRTRNNPDILLDIASVTKPSFEEVKTIWEEQNNDTPLGRTSEESYYFLSNMTSRVISRLIN